MFWTVVTDYGGVSSEPEAFTLLLLMTHVDREDTEKGYAKSYTFEMCNDMPFCQFRVLVPTAAGSECDLAPRTDVVLEVVRVW